MLFRIRRTGRLPLQQLDVVTCLPGAEEQDQVSGTSCGRRTSSSEEVDGLRRPELITALTYVCDVAEGHVAALIRTGAEVRSDAEG